MFRKIITFFTIIFAIIGFLFVSMYFAVKFGFTNTTGIIDQQRDQFIKDGTLNLPPSQGFANSSSNTPFEVIPEEKPEFKT